MTTNDTRPLSERLAEIADLPSIGINLTLERRTAIAEAVEMMKRVEAAPVIISQPINQLPVRSGKRVALVEVPGE